MTSSVSEMERPRGEIIANFTEECNQLKKGMENGFDKIKETASNASKKADELQANVNSAASNFNTVTAKEHEANISETKEAFLKEVAYHSDTTNKQIIVLQEGSENAVLSTDTYFRTKLLAYEDVVEPASRKQIPCNEELSKTPSENEILVSLTKKLDGSSVNNGDKAGKVLQNFNPNLPLSSSGKQS
jgi:hypothetical protein